MLVLLVEVVGNAMVHGKMTLPHYGSTLLVILPMLSVVTLMANVVAFVGLAKAIAAVAALTVVVDS